MQKLIIIKLFPFADIRIILPSSIKIRPFDIDEKKVSYEGLYNAPPVIGFTTPVVEGKVIGILCKCLAVKSN